MKQVRVPRELEYLLDEARPELEVDSSSALPPLNRGQDKHPCPHIEYCHTKRFGKINCLNQDTINSCQSNKFYNKYGENLQ